MWETKLFSTQSERMPLLMLLWKNEMRGCSIEMIYFNYILQVNNHESNHSCHSTFSRCCILNSLWFQSLSFSKYRYVIRIVLFGLEWAPSRNDYRNQLPSITQSLLLIEVLNSLYEGSQMINLKLSCEESRFTMPVIVERQNNLQCSIELGNDKSYFPF